MYCFQVIMFQGFSKGFNEKEGKITATSHIPLGLLVYSFYVAIEGAIFLLRVNGALRVNK